jgi:hypothetical protein
MRKYLIIGVILSPLNLNATNLTHPDSIEEFIRGIDLAPPKASLQEPLIKGDYLVECAEREENLEVKQYMYGKAVNAYESVKNSPEVAVRPQLVDYWGLTGKIVITSGKALNCQRELGRSNK